MIGFELRFVLYIKSFKKVLVLLGSANTNDNGKGFGVIEAIGDDVGVVVTHPLGIDTSIKIVRTLIDQSRDCTFVQ